MQAILLCEFYGRFRGSRVMIRPSESFQEIYSRVSLVSPSLLLSFCLLIPSHALLFRISLVLFCHLPTNMGTHTQRLHHRWPPPTHRLITTIPWARALKTGTAGLLPSLTGDFCLLVSFWMSTHLCTMNFLFRPNSLPRRPLYP